MKCNAGKHTSGWNVIFSNPQLGPTIRVVLYDLRAVTAEAASSSAVVPTAGSAAQQ
jgi:hypothetical protein